MPAVHGQYARPCRVVMERRVRTAAGRTNLDRGQCAAAASPSPSQLPGVKAMVQLRKEREARQRDADGELPGAIGHHPTLHQQMRAHNAAPSPATESSGGHRDERASARMLRRGLRKAYANLVGGSRPQSSGAVQAMLEDRCGVFVPDDVAQVLSSLVGSFHAPADPHEKSVFGQQYGHLQLALEQKEKFLMKALRQQVHDGEKGDRSVPHVSPSRSLEGGQQLLSLPEIRKVMSEFGVGNENMLDALVLAFGRHGGSDGKMTLGELRSAINQIKDPTSPMSKNGWKDKLSEAYDEVLGNSSSADFGLSKDQQLVYSTFLDTLMPALENQLDFMHPSATLIRRRTSGSGKRAAAPRSKSAEPGIFGGVPFSMPTILERGSAPVLGVSDLKNHPPGRNASMKKITDSRDSVNAILKALPPPAQKGSPVKAASRPGTAISSASSCWSEFRAHKNPFKEKTLRMDAILKADEEVFTDDNRFMSVQQLEVLDPGSGLAGEKERLKRFEDQYFQKMENIQKARHRVDGGAQADLEKRDNRHQNRLNQMAEIRKSLQDKVEDERDKKISLGNIMIPSGDMDNAPQFRSAAIFEGPAMNAKRAAAYERERLKNEREEEAVRKAEERHAGLQAREAEKRRIVEEKQDADRVKQDKRDQFVKEREVKKLEKDAYRKQKEGWSVDNALKGIKAEVDETCEYVPEGFTQATLKEEKRLNGIMRQDVRYDLAMQELKRLNDRKRSRLEKLMWGMEPDIDASLPCPLGLCSPARQRGGDRSPPKRATNKNRGVVTGIGESLATLPTRERGRVREDSSPPGSSHCFQSGRRDSRAGRDSRSGRGSKQSLYSQ